MLTQAEYDNTIRRLQNLWKHWIRKQLKHPLQNLSETITQIVSIRESFLHHPEKYNDTNPEIYTQAMEEFALLGVYPEQRDFPERFRYFNQWAFGEILVYFAESCLYDSSIIETLNAYEKGIEAFYTQYPSYEEPVMVSEYPEYFGEFLAHYATKSYDVPDDGFFAKLLEERKKALLDTIFNPDSDG